MLSKHYIVQSALTKRLLEPLSSTSTPPRPAFAKRQFAFPRSMPRTLISHQQLMDYFFRLTTEGGLARDESCLQVVVTKKVLFTSKGWKKGKKERSLLFFFVFFPQKQKRKKNFRRGFELRRGQRPQHDPLRFV